MVLIKKTCKNVWVIKGKTFIFIKIWDLLQQFWKKSWTLQREKNENFSDPLLTNIIDIFVLIDFRDHCTRWHIHSHTPISSTTKSLNRSLKSRLYYLILNWLVYNIICTIDSLVFVFWIIVYILVIHITYYIYACVPLFIAFKMSFDFTLGAWLLQ